MLFRSTETVVDLLADAGAGAGAGVGLSAGAGATDATVVPVSTLAAAEAVVRRGVLARAVGKTAANERALGRRARRMRLCRASRPSSPARVL